jgi:hypothetical protein
MPIAMLCVVIKIGRSWMVWRPTVIVGKFHMMLFNWRLDKAIREKGGSSARKDGESDVAIRDLQGGSSYLCRSRTKP